jgi:uncharacterized DUF497 family protein
MIKFEWDTGKAAANLRKHGVSFDEAGTVFLDQLALSGPDPDHSVGEPRCITLNTNLAQRFVCLLSRSW